MASEVSLSPSSVMEPIPPTKPSSETSLCDVSYEGEFLGGTTTTAPDTPLSTTATYLFRRASRGSTFRPTRLRTRTEDTVPSKGTSYRRLLSGCSYNSAVLPMVSTNSHNSFRAIVGDEQATPYTMTEENPFDSSKEMTMASAISSLSNDSAHRFQSKTEASSDDKKPPPAEIFVITSTESFEIIDAKEEDWKQRWADGTDQTEEETDAPFDEIIEEKNTERTFSKPPPPPLIPSLSPGTPVQIRRRAPIRSAEKINRSPLPLQRIKSAPDVSTGGARMPVTNAIRNTARATTTTQQHSPSLHRVNTDTTVTTTTANTANSGRPAMVQRSTTMPAVPMLGDRPRRKDQKLPPAETVFSFGSRVGQSSMMTPTSATTTTGPMSDLSPRIMIPRGQLSRRKKNGVQQDIEFLWKKVASPVRRWAGSDDKVNLRRSKTGCLA